MNGRFARTERGAIETRYVFAAGRALTVRTETISDFDDRGRLVRVDQGRWEVRFEGFDPEARLTFINAYRDMVKGDYRAMTAFVTHYEARDKVDRVIPPHEL